MSLDATHDPALRSWVESAHAADTDFPIQNLPFGRFRRRGTAEAWRCGIAIGDQVLDLAAAHATAGWPQGVPALLAPLAAGDLNGFMAMGAAARRTLRAALSRALAAGSAQQAALAGCLLPQAQAQMALPCNVRGYTDFYTGIHHATAVGKLFRPDQPLLPNYKWVPIGYHGRTSTIAVSGTDFHRPQGQFNGNPGEPPGFGPCRRLDYELELGILAGAGNPDSMPMTMQQAEADWFGVVLLNDWSARDVQAWEYQPLGPFLAKNFATTISPWVVTQEALEPFRAPFARPAGDPPPLPYLDAPANRERGAVAITLQVALQTAAMRARGEAAAVLMQSDSAEAMYWTFAQLLAHHTVNGCVLQPGDLLGSGTLSGPDPRQGGSLLELSQGGKQPIALPGGESRTFLLDGDAVTLGAHCDRAGARRIGFGDCTATVLPPR